MATFGCHFLLQCMKVKSESEVAESCPTLSALMDCSLPSSSIHGIFQARVLEWGAIAFSKCSLGISNFLEEISSLSHSIVFLYFFALITEEGFLSSPYHSLKLCIQVSPSLPFSFASRFSFLKLFVKPAQTTTLPSCTYFSL